MTCGRPPTVHRGRGFYGADRRGGSRRPRSWLGRRREDTRQVVVAVVSGLLLLLATNGVTYAWGIMKERAWRVYSEQLTDQVLYLRRHQAPK